MSDPRLLSAEKLDEELHICVFHVDRSRRSIAEMDIRRHITALTEQLAALRAEITKLGQMSDAGVNRDWEDSCRTA